MNWQGLSAAYKKAATQEEIFAEPASCASLAGVIKSIKKGKIEKGARIVAVLTGHGLKDPDTAISSSIGQPVQLPNDEKVVADYIMGVVKQ